MKKRQINIVVAQTLEELKFILISTKKDIICLPLNLEILVYCDLNRIAYIDLLEFNKKNFHENALLLSEKLIKNLKYGDIKNQSQKEIFRSLIRFKFFSIYFLLETFKEIEKKYIVDQIFLSGWNSYEKQYSYKNYFLSYLFKKLFENKKLVFIENFREKEHIISKPYDYKIVNDLKYEKREKILLNNIGYNFLRIALFFKFKKKFGTIIPIEKKDYNLSILKKIFFKILGIDFLVMEKKETKLKNFDIPDINFSLNGQNISQVMNYFKRQEIGNHYSLLLQYKVIDKIFDKKNIRFVFVNFYRGLSGYMIEKGIKRKTKCICVPHGTISKFFSKFDKIYKKIISDTLIFNSKKIYVIAQSKISFQFKKAFKFKNKFFNFGNVIFSSPTLNIFNIRKNIFYAVTIKDFKNLQFYGVEMFYEYYDNLKLLNNLAKNYNLNIIVKPHPTEFKSIEMLKKKFTNLKFTKGRISKILSSCFATISYSSTIIEDSLNSNVPVILFDKWKRYKHCESEINQDKKFSNLLRK